jgi:hypothetical protein
MRRGFRAFHRTLPMRVEMNDMAFSTMSGYQKILDAVWKPEIGNDELESIVYSRLAAIAAAHTTKKKTYNNTVSALRCAFDFGYKDHPEKHNPASGLATFRIQKKDRPPSIRLRSRREKSSSPPRMRNSVSRMATTKNFASSQDCGSPNRSP